MKDESAWRTFENVYLTDEELTGFQNEDEDPLPLIKKRFFANVWNEMREFGEREPPFIAPESKFVRYGRKAEVVETNSKKVKYARMKAEEDKFIIYLNGSLTNTRKRSYLAHELGHTYLYDIDQIPFEPRYDREGLDDPKWINTYSMDEGFAWEVAAYLLIPSESLEKFGTRVPSLYALNDMSDKYQVTDGVLIRRLFWDTYDWDKGSNYWNKSILIRYPVSKSEGDNYPPPEGSEEIFKGTEFKNLNIRENWSDIVPGLAYTLNHPKQIIEPQELEEVLSETQITYKDFELTIEMRYISNNYVYILLFPKELIGSREFVTLSNFAN